MTARAIVLTGFGINCDVETAFALGQAGAAADRVHLNDIIAEPDVLDAYQVFVIPGGFSFGDDVASGKILANRLRYRLGGQLRQFVRDGKLILGICNGFQVLAKMGMLPMLSGDFVQEVTLTFNDSGRFEDRWVCLRTEPGTRCIWLNGITDMELPVRHGEGKFVPRDSDVLNRMKAEGLVALRYVRPDGAPARGEFPANPNGSIEDIAGICDVTGRVFGLMPHPEGHICRMQHPRWTRERDAAPDSPAIGLRVFENAVNYVRRYLAA